MTAQRMSSVQGTVTNGVLLWNGSIWTNDLMAAVNVKSGYALFLTGSGSPEGAVTAAVGTAYLRSNGGAGTTLYVKESGSGNTGWAAK